MQSLESAVQLWFRSLCLLASGALLLTGPGVYAQSPAAEAASPEQGAEGAEYSVDEQSSPASQEVTAQQASEPEPSTEPRAHVALPGALELAPIELGSLELGVSEIQGYPVDERGVAMPANVETDLQTSFPKRNSLLPSIPPPRPWFEFKDGLYERIGLKLAFSYQMIYQGASNALPEGQRASNGKQTAWAGSVLVEGQWVLYQRDKDYQGSLFAAFDWRHTLQNTSQPAFLALNTGSLWPSDFYYLSWRPWVPVLFYEQAFKNDVLTLRVGNMFPTQFFDFFRFKDPRTSFSATPFTAPTTTMPFPGLALA